MRLKNYSEAPVGGWYYTYQDKDGNEFRVTSSNLRSLIRDTSVHMRSNHYEVPNWLADDVEDQICRRQPDGRCWYENKAGDQISKVIHRVAGGIDSAAASIGLNTKFQKRARGCNACGQRRTKMNQWGHKI